MYGLADTYARNPETNTTTCRPDQPDSVMCSAGFPNLTADDIAGIRAVFAEAHPTLVVATNASTRILAGTYRPQTEDLCQSWNVRPEMQGTQLAALTIGYCGDVHRDDCLQADVCTYGQWRIEAIRETSFVFVEDGVRRSLTRD